MKKYKTFMDGVTASDTLRQRLVELETPAGRPIPWKRYGSLAAALALVVGLGAWGLRGGFPFAAGLDAPLDSSAPENIDIALVEPGDVVEPGQKTIGGYDVVSGSGPNAIVSHYVLPYIEYGDVSGTGVCIDWDIPQGATRWDLTGDEIIALLGGGDAVNTHLDWSMYALTGWAACYGDGSFWGAYINGQLPNYDGPWSRFEFAVTAGQLPPTCFAFPESVTQEVRELVITADGYDSVATPSGGEDASSRRVSFMKDNYGYRFDITGSSRAQTEERVSRLVCHIADRGLDLSVVSAAQTGTTYTCDICGHDFPVGSTHNHPFMGADGVCPDCGAAIPAGTNHVCQISDGHPLAHTCEICGEVYAAGTEHHCAGGTYTCPDCGQTIPVDGMRAHVHSFATCPTCGESYAAGAEHHCAGGTYTCPDCGETCRSGAEHHCTGGTYVCPDCGETCRSGAEHHCAGGTYTCPTCGETCHNGTEHHCTGGTYVCPDCGQTVQNGAAHSHSSHGSGHHGDSHH